MKSANTDFDSQNWEDAASMFASALKEDPTHKVRSIFRTI